MLFLPHHRTQDWNKCDHGDRVRVYDGINLKPEIVEMLGPKWWA
jgi:hypothetical protein